MSAPKRYAPTMTLHGPTMQEDEGGRWVTLEDYRRLERRLRAAEEPKPRRDKPPES